ncbi:hypothetical protein Tco_1359396, partial [Tanacetum coccineum]
SFNEFTWYKNKVLHIRIAAYSDQARPNQTFVSTSWCHPWDPILGITLVRMSMMANATPIVTTVTKTTNKEKASERTRRERENSLNLRAKNSSVRFHPERSRTRGRERCDDRNVFSCLSHRRKSVHERLSDTYSGPGRTDLREPSHSRGHSHRGHSYIRERSQMEDRSRGIEESYGDTYSQETTTKYRNRSRNVKKWRESKSPSSRGSESSISNEGHWKSRIKRRKLEDENDLAEPWTCEDVDPFTPRIRNFKSSRMTHVLNNVKTYDGTGDLEDHLKIFQVAAHVEHWAMPTWCHMFNSTLIEAARVWFDELPPESIDRYKGLKAAFLDTSCSRRIETGRMKGAPECMRISGFMHEEKPLLLLKGKVTYRGNYKTIPSGRPLSKNLTFEVSQGKDEGLVGLLPLSKRPRKSSRPRQERLNRSHLCEITFLPLADSDGTEGPLVIEAEIGGYMIHRIYINGGSFTEILYEHCFNQLRLEIRSQMVPARTSLTGFSGETIWPLGQLRLLVTIGDADHCTKAWMDFTIVRSISPYNGIIGTPGIREIQAVPSTAHIMLKFLADGGIVTICSTILIPIEYATVIMSPKEIPKEALECTKAIQAEVQKLVAAGITREVYYHDWLSNPVMVKKHDGSWRMCVDFTDLNKAYPQDCYPLPEIDWKIESLCGYPFKCFLDTYKGYH